MAYDASNTFATVDDIKQRTGERGYLNLADRDSDNVVSNDELDDVETCIESANQVVDAAVQTFIDPDAARAASNEWLKDRCVDIAVYNIATIGGRDAPEAWVVARDDAIADLTRVTRGELKVPRLSYPDPIPATQRTRGVPRAINIK